MKHYLKNLILLQILSCIFLKSAAQTNSLPQNSTAFLFNSNISNSSYSNPALAMLITKNNYTSVGKAAPVTVNAIVQKEITSDDICMFANLTEDELWVELKNNEFLGQKPNVEIYNDCGERIYHSTIEKNLHKINVCDFTSGTFLIKLGDTAQKMIIE